MEGTTKIKTVLVAASRKIHSDFSFKQLTSGHINQTYLVNNNGEQLLLQRLNMQVFKNLEGISQNILAVGKHLKQKAYSDEILELLPFVDGDYLYEGEWRMFKYMQNTQTFLKVQSEKQTYEAAKFLSAFHASLSDIELQNITDSIDGFLDFKMRSEQYQEALQNATENRLKKAEESIIFLKENKNILEEWHGLLPQIPKRVIHADPKISNFLFDKEDENKVVALIDWDTILRGSILYDFGDMVRSYTNLKEEDCAEVGDNFSLENYKALEKGFLYYLSNTLTDKEIQNLELGVKTVIYVQAMRFLTDYLNGDIYYSVQRPEHNLDRAKSQINLLNDLQSTVSVRK